MIFLISLALTAVLIAAGKDFIKRHAALCYAAATAISAVVVVCTFTGASAAFPGWVRTWVWPLFARSALSTALFAAVMYAGAVPHGSRLMKTLMPIRGELSIIASILTLGHNIAYGKTYFRMLFTRPERLALNQLLAAVCSLVMLCIMLPLFITSFKCVRRKMKGRTWKKLQRLAYGFYGLIYVHVLLLTLPGAQKGDGGYLLTVLVYSAVFLTYAAMRAGKALRAQPNRVRRAPVVAAVCIFLLVACAAGVPYAAAQAEVPQDEPGMESPDVSQSGALSGAQSSELTDQPDESGAQSTPDVLPEEPEQPEEIPDQQPADSGKNDQSGATVPEQPQPAAKPEVPAPETPKAEPSQPETPAAPAQPSEPPAEEPSVPAPEPEPEVTYQYQNGTFTGTGEGFADTITVQVTIDADKITNITVVSAGDDEPYWSEGKAVISRILAAQSTNVDTVSGATYSSGGILQAVRAALNSAKH